MIYLSVQMFCLEASSKVCWAFVSTLHYYCDKAPVWPKEKDKAELS